MQQCTGWRRPGTKYRRRWVCLSCQSLTLNSQMGCWSHADQTNHNETASGNLLGRSIPGDAWGAAPVRPTLYSVPGHVLDRLELHRGGHAGLYPGWPVEFLQDANDCACYPGDSPFPADALQNRPHSKGDRIFVGLVSAAGRWRVVLSVAADRATHLAAKCTQHCECLAIRAVSAKVQFDRHLGRSLSICWSVLRRNTPVKELTTCTVGILIAIHRHLLTRPETLFGKTISELNLCNFIGVVHFWSRPLAGNVIMIQVNEDLETVVKWQSFGCWRITMS